ncbi:uncharacterized protein LOC121864774 [Homarus americanus]|uniref:uncharacterized protein LOC121864774 n=1 Tax=Homarus americanus TaxID=6706 RepID=UPI001C45FC11|nr:uncharacterized protein LOC121864774 [Homarus americanus]XP_042219878.1 uncharacterized protein LOC121864774 [Homarus americanus]XP_042219879.1 uncharacterized protein LOC121864774 [Homarus americanus]XP_042219880.1 uncharacterized protein LOC121864774 [Homarus americanus]XP_042219881.1 uncharacterized protein LOC121864774 [Homarus americanus]XP_042219882.1 uncharacterized protein LOC121864774 [Homarus americanus]
MSSSCVPPKGCVVHNHDSYNYDDHDDSSSECGSLCTCTSSSMTSLTSSTVSRDPSRLGQNSESSVSLAMPSTATLTATHTATRTATNTTTQTATQTTDSSSGNPYIVVFVPPQMVPGRIRTSCGNCQNHKALQEALRTSLMRACDFFPWVAGFVIIYYSFYWWGLGSGFSAILFTVGAHAIIRFVKTRGVLECSSINSSQPQQEDDPSEEDEEESEGETQQRGQEEVVTRDLANEKPPSYEAAVVKPPPYDLQFHLTPRQSRCQAVLNHPDDKNVIKVDFLTVPTLTVDNTKDVEGALDDKEDLSLPSYQDAIRLSFRSDKSSMGNQDRE